MNRKFTDPIAQVIIKNFETGDEYHVGSPSFPFLTSVTIKQDLEMTIAGMTIGVEIPYEYAIRWTDPRNTPFKMKNTVYARIGYAYGGWTEWVQGILNDGGKGLTMTPDGLTGALTATWISTKPAGYTVPKDVLKSGGDSFENTFKEIAKIVGFDVEFTENSLGILSSTETNTDSSVSFVNSEKFKSELSSMGMWDALKHICKTNDLKFYVKRESNRSFIVVYSDKDSTTGELGNKEGVKRKYVVRGVLDESIDQYPCFSFTPSSDDSTWVPRTATVAASGVDAYGISSETGEDVRKTVRPEDQEHAIDGKIENDIPSDIRVYDQVHGEFVADALKNDTRQGTYMSAPILPGGKNVFIQQAFRYQRQGTPGLRMELATIGIPEEEVGNHCFLQGATSLFNDEYYIEGITHMWTPGNWDMMLNVHRWGIKGTPGAQKETLGGQMTR